MAMSFDTRNNSALMKRAEQLRRWEESDTNREPTVPRNETSRRIRFSSGCVFLAACVAGDKDEVIRLLDSGADINTANVDGLTALHQACIDDNLEMVEFLVEHGADINRQDNEGWTPLHATASCGFVSIARYLVENGADLTEINSDGELAIDLASTNAMADYLQNLYDELGIDCDSARQIEEQTMLNDAKKWLKSDASEADKPHPKTGATALHVAAAKGYTKVLGLLLAGRANVDKQDSDGWTPLHAAAHWGQKEAAEMLIDAMADIDIKNYAGQTPIDVAEPKIIRFLEELKANNKRAKRRPSSQIRISDTIENHIETPTKLIRVEVKSDSKDSITTTTTTTSTPAINDDKPKPPIEPAKPPPPSEIVEEDAPWRRNSSLRARSQQESPPKSQVPDKDKSTDSEVILRRTQSFENDEKFYQKYHELRARIKANSCPILPATQTTGVISSAVNTPNNYSVQRSASLKDHRHIRKPISPPVSPNTPVTTTIFRRSFVPPVRDEESETQRKAHAKRVRETRRSTQGVTLDEIKSAEELVKKKNLTNNNNNSSNTNNNNNNNNTNSSSSSTTSSNTNNNSTSNFKLEDASTGTTTTSTFPPSNSTIITSAPAVIAAASLSSMTQRRTNNAVNATSQTPRPVSAPSSIISSSSSTGNDNSSNDRINPITSTNNTSSDVTITLRRNKNSEDKENDKENDSRSAQATQAVIQRRRRPKRRSTGVVHLDMDDIDPDKQDSPGDNEEKESGSERVSRSRLGSTSSLADTEQTNDNKASGNKESSENGGEFIDYKALWEAVKLENEKLKQQLKKKDDELTTAKATIDRFTNATTKNSLSELEKRERRAMERKLSEMEEELKQLDLLKTENQRLKEENGALIRVISKLSK